jgi:hypothetical protein
LTLNQLTQQIKDICLLHKSISNIGDVITYLNYTNIKYMLMNLDVIDNNIDEFTQSFTIRFICLDVVYDNKYIYEIFNDVNLVINDIFNNLKLSEINIYIENEELILNKIQDKYVDSVAGFYFDIIFNLEKTNFCV